MDIYRVGDAVLVLGKRAEILHALMLSPQKRDGIKGSILTARGIPNPTISPFVIDGGRRIACVSAEISQIDWSAVLVSPKHGMSCARPTDSIRAQARDGGYLLLIIDASAVRVSGKWRQRGNFR